MAIKTPTQLENAHTFLKRWRAFGSLLDIPEYRIMDRISEPYETLFGHGLSHDELRHVRKQAAASTLDAIRLMRSEAHEALITLGVDPEVETPDD